MSVGITSDTGAFAVNSIRSWWQHLGHKRYRNARTLTITADGGGSNSSRTRLWKTELQKLANELQIAIRASPLPARDPRTETKSSTACSATSASTGAGGRWRACR